MSWTALLLAATLPLGVWPDSQGPPSLVVGEVAVYTVEPDEDYWILAVLPLVPPARLAEGKALTRLAQVAARLGADAVLLLAELPVAAIPSDPEAPLPTTDRFAAAAFLLFDVAEDEDEPSLQRTTHRHGAPPGGPAGVSWAARVRQDRDERLIIVPPAPRARKMLACTAVRYWGVGPAKAR